MDTGIYKIKNKLNGKCYNALSEILKNRIPKYERLENWDINYASVIRC
jgi:hypothetical protein